jgi:small subunit ribosomal protein S18
MPPKRPKAKDTTKKIKKKTSVLTLERVEYIDYKDVNLLQKFVSDRSKIRARRVSGNSTQQQREIAVAVKNAREMALLPYTKRVATQGRGPKGAPRDAEAAAGAEVDATEVDTDVTEEGGEE